MLVLLCFNCPGNVFTHVCDSVHGEGGLFQGDPPGRDPRQRPPWTETPLDRDPPGQRPPWTENPLDRDPPGQRPPWTETPHMVTSGQYASYWNAFLCSCLIFE